MSTRTAKPVAIRSRRVLGVAALTLVCVMLAPARGLGERPVGPGAAPAPALAGILLSPRTRLIIDYQRVALA